MGDAKDFTVLVVEDEETLRGVIADTIQRHGYTVLQAEDGPAGFRIVCDHKVDLVISDVRMPNGTGVDLLVKITTLPPPQPPVILMSGFAEITEAQARELGAVALISKPFRSKDLLGLVTSVHERRQTSEKPLNR